MKTLTWLFAFIILFGAGANACVEGEVRTSSAGAKFTCDKSMPQLGQEAFKDPKGLIWGEIYKGNCHPYGSDACDSQGFLKLSQEQAIKHCEDIGAKLPTREQYQSLQSLLGKSSFSRENSMLQVLASGDYAWTSTQAINDKCPSQDLYCGYQADIDQLDTVFMGKHYPNFYLVWYQSGYGARVRCVSQSK